MVQKRVPDYFYYWRYVDFAEAIIKVKATREFFHCREHTKLMIISPIHW